MSATKTSHAYGIGIMTVIIGSAAGVIFYQAFYLPESLEKPSIDEHLLNPELGANNIKIISGSGNPDQIDNYIPKLLNVELGVDNLLIWTNDDDTAHTITPDHSYKDAYSGKFGSDGVILPNEKYEFLFTAPSDIEYHCEPHPWMKGKLVITEKRS